MLEWRQEIVTGDMPLADIRIGLSPLLVRDELDAWLGPAAITAIVALMAALLVAVLLSNIVLRPIHVIQQRVYRASGEAILVRRWTWKATSSRSWGISSRA